MGGVLGSVLYSANLVSAQSETDQTIVDRIATRFNLNRDEVQAVFNEEHLAHEQEMQDRISQELDQLVEDGTLTSVQRTVAETALNDMKAKLEESRPDNFHDMTDEERDAMRQAMDEAQDAFKQTLTDNGIDSSVIMEKLHPHGKHHGGMHGMRGGAKDI